MPRQLQPPKTLATEVFFVVRFNRDRRTFELGVPSTGSTYDLGNEHQATLYFASVGQEALGRRAMAAANSFGMSQAHVAEQRAWGCDLVAPGMPKAEADRKLDDVRAFGEDDGDDVEVIQLGINNDEKVFIA